jgi:flavodoxin I
MPARSLSIIFASTSGHTEYVVEQLTAFLAAHKPDLAVTVRRAELAQPEDLTRADVLILASGTWNMHGREGQLNERMHTLLFERCRDIDLSAVPVALISLGDDRYHFTTRCTEHFMRFLKEHNATSLLMPLVIVNEPYGQEEKIRRWGEKLAERMAEEKRPVVSSK